MSRMSDLQIEIVERLDNGQTVEFIANELEIPFEWIECVAEWASGDQLALQLSRNALGQLWGVLQDQPTLC